jgi:hypothetical protein
MINAYSIVKMVKRHVLRQPSTEKIDQGLANKPFTFFYKIAFLRKNFNKSYQQNSSLDPEVEFNSDRDVLRYIPRAMQISSFMPFPNMWLDSTGKSGLMGRLLSAWEMILMMGIMFLLVLKLPKKITQPAVLLCLSAVLIYFIGLGLVVTNGGALYRMRFCAWLLMGALCHASYFSVLVQNNGVEFKKANEE